MKKNFYLIFIAQIISDMGNWFYTVAISTLVFQLTNSALATSFTILVSLLPSAIFSIIGGGISDKLNPKLMMILSDLIRGIMVLFAFLVKSNESIFILYIITFINSILGTLFTTSRYVVINKITPKEDLNKVIATLRIGYEISVVFGSLFGGLLYSSLGFSKIICLNSSSFFLSIIFLFLLKYDYTKIHCSNISDKNISTIINLYKDGFRYIKSNQRLLYLSIFRIFYTIVGGMLNILPSLIAIKIYNYGSKGVGIIYCFIGIGAIIGAYLSIKTQSKNFNCSFLFKKFNSLNQTKTLMYCAFISIIGWAMIFFGNSFFISVIGMSIVSIGNILSHTYIESLSISTINDDYVGRVTGTLNFITNISLIVSLTMMASILDYNLNIAIILGVFMLIVPNFIFRNKNIITTIKSN